MALTGPEGDTVSHIERRHGTVQPIRKRRPDKGTWVGPPDVGEPVPEASKRYLEALAAKAAGLAGQPNAQPVLNMTREQEAQLNAPGVPSLKFPSPRYAAAMGLSAILAQADLTDESRKVLIQALGVVGTLP